MGAPDALSRRGSAPGPGGGSAHILPLLVRAPRSSCASPNSVLGSASAGQQQNIYDIFYSDYF